MNPEGEELKAMPTNVALFIDGANFYTTAKTLGFDIDYKRLLKEFQGRGTLLGAFYYTAIFEDQEYSSIRPLIDWLDYNGYTVVTKATKEFIDAGGRRKVKGNMDVELAVDAMELAGHVDEIVLFSGDGDFRSLVEAVQRRGVRVPFTLWARERPILACCWNVGARWWTQFKSKLISTEAVDGPTALSKPTQR
jgi:uncharacterized LabA/DUF88 family protein